MGETIKDCTDSFNDLIGADKNRSMASVIIMATVWFIWRARNDFIFNAKPLSIEGVMDLIMVHPFLWLKHRSIRVVIMWHKWCYSP